MLSQTTPWRIHILENSEADFNALQRALKSALSPHGIDYELTWHTSAEAAEASLLGGARPDLMFVDLDLPGTGGEAFLRRFEPDRWSFRAAIVSSSAAAYQACRKGGDGTIAYIAKTLRYEDFRPAVDSWLRQFLCPDSALPMAQ